MDGWINSNSSFSSEIHSVFSLVRVNVSPQGRIGSLSRLFESALYWVTAYQTVKAAAADRMQRSSVAAPGRTRTVMAAAAVRHKDSKVKREVVRHCFKIFGFDLIIEVLTWVCVQSVQFVTILDVLNAVLCYSITDMFNLETIEVLSKTGYECAIYHLKLSV